MNEERLENWKLVFSGLALLFLFIIIMEGIASREYAYEVWGNCNSGFIGIDFSEKFIFNDKWKTNKSEEKMIWYPQRLDLKNIDGLNCNFRVKGTIPYKLIKDLEP